MAVRIIADSLAMTARSSAAVLQARTFRIKSLSFIDILTTQFPWKHQTEQQGDGRMLRVGRKKEFSSIVIKPHLDCYTKTCVLINQKSRGLYHVGFLRTNIIYMTVLEEIQDFS